MTKLQLLYLLVGAALLASCQATRDAMAQPGATDTLKGLVDIGVDAALRTKDFASKAEVATLAKDVAGDLIDAEAAKGVTTGEVGGIAAAVTALGGIALNYLRNQKYKSPTTNQPS